MSVWLSTSEVVSTVAFQGFSCFQFESGRSWLIADLSIECNTPNHESIQALAWIAVAFYPIGLLVISSFLLLHERKAIVSHRTTSLSRALAFLYTDYTTTCWWWELMECAQGTLDSPTCVAQLSPGIRCACRMLRKFLVVGLFVRTPPQGSILQMGAGTTVCACYLVCKPRLLLSSVAPLTDCCAFSLNGETANPAPSEAIQGRARQFHRVSLQLCVGRALHLHAHCQIQFPYRLRRYP